MIVLGIKQKEDAFSPDYLTKAELTALKKIFWDTAHNRSKVSQSLLEHVSPDRVELMMPIEDLYKLTEQIDRANDRINDQIKISELTDNQRKIYYAIIQIDRINDRINDRANIIHLIKATNLSYSTIQRALRVLEKGLLVKRVGAKKKMYWTTKYEKGESQPTRTMIER